MTREEFLALLKRQATPKRGGTAPAEGSPAPDFELVRLDGTGKLTLKGLLAKERPVVIAFGSVT